MNRPGFPKTRTIGEAHAPMTQANIVLLFLYGFAGIMLWIIGVIALDIFHDSQRISEKGPNQAHHNSTRL